MIPVGTIEALTRYLEYGISPGSGLTAVLEGDLFGAYASLDRDNLSALNEIVDLIRHRFPSASYGSRKNTHDWGKDSELRDGCSYQTNKVVQHLGQMLHNI